ncbi:hypothetical protein [Actinocrispum wychmicini]|uniref:Uncharacterized protein n=1 Tax=Actinocrispum wychmicini TaxID=1213861 RepID=A0A4R2JJN8_9PSEU|nr:hypothetical protein [Actinocrispum wychmicini]TCO57228.1 hypothetical protein EV192_106705 [Actinocrispum wychmicini]
MTVAEWKTDTELYDIADRLAHKIIDMYTKADVFISVGTNRNTVIDGLRLDADMFTSLDPQKIADEFQRMQRAATDTGQDAVARSLLDAANNKLTTIWRGDAAEAFGHQMSYIETFTQQQDAELTFAAHSMGTAYALAVQVRRSYHELADATIAACAKEMSEQTERDTQAAIGLFAEIAKACVTGWVKPESGAEVVRWGLESFIDIGSKTQEVLVEGSKAEEVVGNYVRTRDTLKGSFEEGLNILTKWITTEDTSLAADKIPLLEPMPPGTNVNGPDFSYDKFFDPARDPSSFGGRVEQERKKARDQQNRPAGLIARRLDGGRS